METTNPEEPVVNLQDDLYKLLTSIWLLKYIRDSKVRVIAVAKVKDLYLSIIPRFDQFFNHLALQSDQPQEFQRLNSHRKGGVKLDLELEGLDHIDILKEKLHQEEIEKTQYLLTYPKVIQNLAESMLKDIQNQEYMERACNGIENYLMNPNLHLKYLQAFYDFKKARQVEYEIAIDKMEQIIARLSSWINLQQQKQSPNESQVNVKKMTQLQNHLSSQVQSNKSIKRKAKRANNSISQDKKQQSTYMSTQYLKEQSKEQIETLSMKLQKSLRNKKSLKDEELKLSTLSTAAQQNYLEAKDHFSCKGGCGGEVFQQLTFCLSCKSNTRTNLNQYNQPIEGGLKVPNGEFWTCYICRSKNGDEDLQCQKCLWPQIDPIITSEGERVFRFKCSRCGMKNETRSKQFQCGFCHFTNRPIGSASSMFSPKSSLSPIKRQANS